MSEHKGDTIPCVGCEVTGCATEIHVRSEKAENKGETYCSTFCPRGCC